MANNPRIDIGVRVDYKDVLNEMKSEFKKELTEISNHAQKTSFDANIEKKLKRIDDKVDSVFGGLEKRLDELSNQTISTDNFEKFQKEVKDSIASVKRSITGVTKDISGLRTEVGMISGADFASDMKKQFDEVRDSMLGTCEALGQLLDLKNSSSAGLNGGVNSSTLKNYKKTLVEINKYRKEMESLNFGDLSDDDIYDNFDKQEESMSSYMETYKKLKSELENTPKSSEQYDILENKLVQVQIAALRASETIQELTAEAENRGINIGIHPQTQSIIKEIDLFDGEVENFSVKAKKFVDANKETQNSIEQTQTAFNTFTIKNGAIHVPVEVATKSGTLQKQLQETIDKLQEYAQKNSIIAKVKLVLDGGSASGYKKNDDITKQLEDGQGEPAVDISKAIKKTYVQAVREAEKTAKDSIKAIQDIFNDSPVKITPNKKVFAEELSDMVSSSLNKIANDTTGLNVNKELEKLVANLKEVSTSLSGNESFKFGLDEDSINAITKAIQNMADMIQRAFKVASNADIDKQWALITDKFKGSANDNGKLLLKDGEKAKAAIHEIAVEYKKYLDMGGKNNLSDLTKDTRSIKNITNEYENLGKAVKEVAQKQEKQAKKKTESKISSEEKEAIKGVTKQNKSLEEQAEKTSKALKNEGNTAEAAAGKFRKLAKEKGTAVVANRELAKAAKETADALERESKARKETGAKTSKNAVDDNAYATNALKWQKDIRQSLMDSGDYEEIYGAKISQAANGVVKFTANVRVGEKEWKKFTATVSDTGAISNPQLQDLTEKQIITIEKAKAAWEKYVDAMASEGEEPTFFNRAELESYIQTILEAEEGLEKFKIKKVEINSGGKLAITTEFKEADGQVKTFVANFNSVEDIIDETTGSVKNLAQALESAFDSGKIAVSQSGSQSSVLSRYEEIYSIAKKLGNLDVKIASLDSTKNANQIQELTAQYRELEEVYTTLVHAFFKDADLGKLPMGSFQELTDIFEGVKRKIDEVNAKLKDAQENLERGFGSKAQDAFSKFELKYQGNSNWSKISAEVEELRQNIAGIDSQDKLNEFKQKIADIVAKLNNIGKDNKLGNILGGDRTFKDINEVRANIDSLFASMGKVNEKSIRVKGTDKLTAEVKSANGEIRKMTVSLDSNGFARFVDNGIVQFGRLRAAAEGVFKGIQSMVRIYLSPQDFIRYFRQGFDAVREIDTAMTELKKVSDASPSDITAYFGDAVASAKELGSSVNEMIGATADWQRMGYNLPDSRELGEVAVLYKNVGDGIDVDTANESLVSTMQGFQLQAEDAMSVIDAFNEVSNNYAISSAGIGEALKRSAAAFNAANTDLNQSIALITAGNEIVQSPEKVGTMWQTVSARIRGKICAHYTVMCRPPYEDNIKAA